MCYAYVMGILVQNSEKRSELGDKISADLRERGRRNSLATGEFDADYDLDDREFTESDTKKTSRFGWVWLVLIVLAVISLVIVFIP